MSTRAKLRTVIALIVLASSFCPPANAEPISISPNRVSAGTSPTLTITSSPFFINLAQLNVPQLEVNPSTDISNFRVLSAAPDRLTLSFDVAKTATGDRTLNIKLSEDVIVSIRLSVERDPLVCSPACVSPRVCERGRCELPQ
jgi:hypothetical protein